MITERDILQGHVLIVDDQPANVQLLERTLRSAGYVSITTTTSPDSVFDLHLGNRYDLILLDLQMPGIDGFQVMKSLKRIEPDGYLPVLVITAQPDHKLRALRAGAKDFISKPFDLAEVLLRVRNMLEVRLLHRALLDYGEELETRVRERTAELQDNYLETIFTMTRAAELRDEDTGFHVQRISHYSRLLAGLLGLDEAFQHNIFIASPMHDIGKIGIPDSVLQKPGVLTPEDWSVMKMHTAMGAKILGVGKSPYLMIGAEIALNHHERWDGSGYPHGRRGVDIPLAARIVNICDIYDALRSKRSYKPALDHMVVVDIMTHGNGRTQPEHFDPVLLAAFAGHHLSFRDIFDSFRG